MEESKFIVDLIILLVINLRIFRINDFIEILVNI